MAMLEGNASIAKQAQTERRDNDKLSDVTGSAAIQDASRLLAAAIRWELDQRLTTYMV
jgi:hypothetical protein